MFLSHLKDENTNRGAADESKNNLGSSFLLMTLKQALHIYCTHWWWNV